MPNVPNGAKTVCWSLKSIPCPCKGCEKRSVWCHSSCVKYKVYVIRIRAERKKIEKAYKPERRTEDYHIRSVQKTRKK